MRAMQWVFWGILYSDLWSAKVTTAVLFSEELAKDIPQFTCHGGGVSRLSVVCWFLWSSFVFYVSHALYMMTSSNGNIFRATGLLWGEPPVTGGSPHKDQWRGTLMFSVICAWTNGWANNRDAGDLRHHCAHYDVTLMTVTLDRNI